METESGLFGRKGPGPRKTDTAGPKKGRQLASDARKTQDATLDKRNDGTSVFVSNLSFSMEDPEKRLRELFQACGPIQQVRPIYNSRGIFRGYCYVQFQEQSSVPQALNLDRQEVDNRPMFVSPCVDKNKNPDFKVTG